MEDKKSIPDDDIFTIEISESMDLRNRLRAGLLEAQNKDGGKIPVYVSWPKWLDNGIVCLYASDFRDILKNTVKETAEKVCGFAGGTPDAKKPKSQDNQAFKSFDIGALEHLSTDRKGKDGKNK